uniref:Chitin-binding type-2 domain-containing protein n=1 Tax=Dendroctonus ponderosae TaxID=77166 RepID=A0AAR5P5I7_DENPD
MGFQLVYKVFLLTALGLFSVSGITTIHHDKPDLITSTLTTFTPTYEANSSSLLLTDLNLTLSSSERKKRLLPYQNFYFNQPFNRPHQAGVSAQQYKDYEGIRRPIKKPELQPIDFRPSNAVYQTGQKFNPFRENNALPGSFRPMVNINNPKPQFIVLENPPTAEDSNKDVNAHSQPSSDLSAIYEKLAQLKLRQQAMHLRAPYGYRLVSPHRFRERPPKIQEHRLNYEVPRYKIQPSKTTIETFTATNIDIPDANEEAKYDYQEPPRYHQAPTPSKEVPVRNQFRENIKPYIHHQVLLEVPQGSIPVHYNPQEVRKPANHPTERPRTYILVQQNKPSPKQPIYLLRKPKPAAIVDESYVAENFSPVVFSKNQNYQQQRPIFVPQEAPAPVYENPYETQYQVTPGPTEGYHQEYQHLDAPNYEDKVPAQKPNQLQPKFPESAVQFNNPEGYYHYQSISPTPTTSEPEPGYQHQRVPEKPPPTIQNPKPYEQEYAATPTTPKLESSKGNSLAEVLKKLQDSNALPQTLTADNIDNSIKTLVKILNALKERQKQQKPVIVQDEYEYDNEAGVDLGGDVVDSPEGGTPGKAGVDYPALSSIPKTTFSCKTQRYKGFFGDPDTNCQVWHYCDLNGGQASFLCPNGTIFSQVALTCDWWYNVKCASTAQLYVLNERLYKYIIPLSPKFPEDYSGPLVDKYLAMKFQEMEEKLRKQKKGKGNADAKESEETTESDDTEDDEDDDDDEDSDSSKEESQAVEETETTTATSQTPDVATIISSNTRK